MLKFSLFFCCVVVPVCCLPQSPAGKDSSQFIESGAKKSTDIIPAKVLPEFSIYPNPAKNKITLQVKNFSPGMVSVKLLDTKGKLVREDKRLLTNGTEDIIMFLMLKAGIYFIMVSEPGKIARKKLVVL